MRSAVMGAIPVQHWLQSAASLNRHLFDTPRRRSKQSAVALNLSCRVNRARRFVLS